MNTTTLDHAPKTVDNNVSAFADKAFFFVKMAIAISAIILVEVSAWI
ncbi:hypothetical protein [Psychromonas sp. B3M02]|nr:hypothetical protein [Psychromonas sp. B3M02]